MKTIKLKSESPLIQERHFIATDFFGRETVGFYYTEKEFVNRSVYYSLFGMDFEEMPVGRGELDEINDSAHENPRCITTLPPLPGSPDYRADRRNKYTTRTYYCDADFYIACDKGDKGYESAFSVFKGHVDETDEEYTVTITIVTDGEVITRIKEANEKENFYVKQFFSEHLTSNLSRFGSKTIDIIRCAKETVFLDLDEQSEYSKVAVEPHGEHYHLFAHEDYKPVEKSSHIVKEGSYIYKSPMKNVVEILQIEYFAHSPYAKFYAVAKTVLMYPRDKAEIKDMFPDFYKEHCVSTSERKEFRSITGAVDVPYIPLDNQLGDEVLYCKLSFNRLGTLIESGMFHITITDNVFFSKLCEDADNRLKAGKCGVNASLIQIGDKFKIMMYRFDRIVKCDGEYYAQLSYDGESRFFADFCGAEAVRFRYNTAFKGLEYLLYKGDIKPIKISRERYEEFKRNED